MTTAGRALLFTQILVISSCAEGSRASDLCTWSGQSNKRVAVEHVYVFGGVPHGATLVDPSCLQKPLTFSALGSKFPDPSVKPFVRDFYMRPKLKGGVFRLSGAVELSASERTAVLKTVSAYSEISPAERDDLFAQLP